MTPLDLSKVINSYLTTIWLNYTWLKLSLEIRRFCFTESNGSNFVFIACTEPEIWTLQSHRTSTLVGKALKMRQIWDMARLKNNIANINGRLVLLCFSHVPDFVYQQQFLSVKWNCDNSGSFSSRPCRRFGNINDTTRDLTRCYRSASSNTTY
jgi:hypothetical protein